jgi:putative two-component system response regulator
MEMQVDRHIVLVVDDIKLNRVILGELLKDEYDVIEAENGQQALKALEEYRPEIAIALLDVMMPGMDGFSLVRAMREKGYMDEIPVFLITAGTYKDASGKATAWEWWMS